MNIVDFFRQYFIEPVILGQGYNFVNTLTYALIVVAVTWLTFKFIEKMKIQINRNFVTSIIILVFFGTFVRLLEEVGISSSYFLVTPMIWIETFAFIFILFLISRFIEKKFKIPYYKILSGVGLALTFIPLFLILTHLTSYSGMLISLGLLIPFGLIFYFIKWKAENKLVSMAHIFDATATFTAIQFYGFSEQHVIPRLIVSLSPISFIIIKSLVVISILILIDRYSEDKKFSNFLKLIIAIIGLAPGIRDFFLLGMV